MVKLSRAGRGKCLATEPATEGGESPVDDGDMLCVRRRSWVKAVVGDMGQTLE